MAKKIVYVKKKADHPPQDEGLPPWMATFADMVTLLLCFFVLLLSFAKQDLEKFRDVLGSLKDAFGTVAVRAESDTLAEMTTTSEETAQAPASQEELMIQGVVVRIKSLLEDADDPRLTKATGVAQDREGALLTSRSALLFEPGTAMLAPGAEEVLSRVITVLKEYDLHLVVRAHTDNTLPRAGEYPSNWELSAARAARILAWLSEVGGIEEKRLKAVGYAQTRPVAPNTTEQGRRANERVEFHFHHPRHVAW